MDMLMVYMVFVMDVLWLAQKSNDGKKIIKAVPIVSHMSIEVYRVNNGVLCQNTIESPFCGPQEGQVCCTAVQVTDTNNSKGPIPNPKAQGPSQFSCV